VPFDFVVFRNLFYFHTVKYFEIGIEKWIPFEEILERYQIKPEPAGRYREMDEKFQGYVYGPERCYKYKEQYRKRQIFIHSLEQTIENQRAVVRKYHDAILLNERAIKEMTDSLSWRLGQKITGTLDNLCPAGSWRRRLAERLIAPLKARSK
jgi:hypothetical protein